LYFKEALNKLFLSFRPTGGILPGISRLDLSLRRDDKRSNGSPDNEAEKRKIKHPFSPYLDFLLMEKASVRRIERTATGSIEDEIYKSLIVVMLVF
jgi:hypothetical protein